MRNDFLAGLTLDKSLTASRAVVRDAERSISWELGDSKQPGLFLPHWKTLHWDNECNLSIRLMDDAYHAASVRQVGETLEWSRAGRTARFYQLAGFEDGGFEIEVEFASRPSSNVVRYSVQTKGLNLFRHPDTLDELNRIHPNSTCPDEAFGSYAAYHESKQHNRPGRAYRAGKAFQIWRPQAHDSAGHSVWCDMQIGGGVLSITVPQAFLDTATYPVVVDPTFGYTTVGADETSVLDVGRANVGSAMRYTAGSGESITMFSLYSNTEFSTHTAIAAAYTWNGTVPVSRLAAGEAITVTTTPGWKDSGTVSQSMANGSTYVMAFNSNSGGALFVKYDGGATNGGRSGDDRAGLAATWSESSSSASTFSMYVTYGTGGGSSTGAGLTSSPLISGRLLRGLLR